MCCRQQIFFIVAKIFSINKLRLYNATQCHPLSGICWCAEPSGAVIAGSSKPKDEIRCDPESIKKIAIVKAQPVIRAQSQKSSGQKRPVRNKNRGTDHSVDHWY